MDNNSLNIKTSHVCRTCMEEIINTSFFNLDFVQVEREPTIAQKLFNCIPELDLNIVQNTVICAKCADTINSLYIFKKECLQVEMQIRECIQQMQHHGSVINLAGVIQFHQLHSKNLTAESTTEAFKKTENYKYEELYSKNLITEFKMEAFDKNEDSPTSFCANYPFNETERYTEIANNEYLTSLQKVERQCMLFNTAEDFIHSGKLKAEENSDMHDDSNIVQDCLLQVAENLDSCTIQNLNKRDIYYQCFTCGHKAESKLKLIRHLKSHTDKKLYRKKISFNIHKGIVCCYSCDLCNYSTKHKCLFSFHNRAHLTKKDYQRILKSRPILVNPSTNTIKFAKKDKKIKCGSFTSNKHNFKYRSKSLSKYSESKQHSNQCNVLKLAIDTNIIVKPEVKSFKCWICGYSTRYKCNLKTHMPTHTAEKPFRCSVCKYSCKQKVHLKSHMLIHTGKKPLKCSVCEYNCNHRNSLRGHMLIHAGAKPFRCSVCEYSCNQKSNLKIHMFTHTGEKPFKCLICEYSCTLNSNLKIHMLTHTGEKPFRCSFCEYSCNQKKSLNKHMLTHNTGEKPFKCSVCEYGFNQKCNLKIHTLTPRGQPL